MVSESVDDVVRQHAENMTKEEFSEPSAWPMRVFEYRHISKPSAKTCLDLFIEGWDEDYNTSMNQPKSEPTPEMLAAMQTLIDLLPVTDLVETGKVVKVTKEDAMKMIGGTR
jgi:hypothetical protein